LAKLLDIVLFRHCLCFYVPGSEYTTIRNSWNPQTRWPDWANFCPWVIVLFWKNGLGNFFIN
jgi:hypothetical protein